MTSRTSEIVFIPSRKQATEIIPVAITSAKYPGNRSAAARDRGFARASYCIKLFRFNAEGQRPDQGHSPKFPFYTSGGAQPRLTSGGQAAVAAPKSPFYTSGGAHPPSHQAAKPQSQPKISFLYFRRGTAPPHIRWPSRSRSPKISFL